MARKVVSGHMLEKSEGKNKDGGGHLYLVDLLHDVYCPEAPYDDVRNAIDPSCACGI